MQKAEEFAAIFDDEDAVLLEAEQAMNPNSYLPQQNDIHRASKEKKLEKEEGKEVKKRKKMEISIKKDIPKKNGGRGRGKVPSTSADIQLMGLSCSQPVVSEDTLQAQVLQVSEILDEEIVPDSQSNFMANPPLIVKTTGMTRKCKGCGSPLTDEDKAYPHDMVFSLLGYWRLLQPEVQ